MQSVLERYVNIQEGAESTAVQDPSHVSQCPDSLQNIVVVYLSGISHVAGKNNGHCPWFNV